MLGVKGHVPRPGGDERGRGMGSGDDDLLALGDELVNVQGHIAGPRRQVEKHVVELVPVNFGEEVAQHLAQHGTAPDHGGVVLHEEGHGDHLHPERSTGRIVLSITSGPCSIPSCRER